MFSNRSGRCRLPIVRRRRLRPRAPAGAGLERFRGRTSGSSSSCPRDRTRGLPREPSRMRSGRPTSGPSPGCRRESGPRGSTSGSRRGRGGEGRRTETTGADIRAARGERDARKGTRLAYSPEYRRPMRMPVFRSVSGCCRSPTRYGSCSRPAPRCSPKSWVSSTGRSLPSSSAAQDCAWAPAPAPEPSPSSNASPRR